MKQTPHAPTCHCHASVQMGGSGRDIKSCKARDFGNAATITSLIYIYANAATHGDSLRSVFLSAVPGVGHWNCVSKMTVFGRYRRDAVLYRCVQHPCSTRAARLEQRPLQAHSNRGDTDNETNSRDPNLALQAENLFEGLYCSIC